jgi:hypothetical protein
MSKPNVWVIGFPRCGTTSLSRALRMLGWNPIDNPRHWDQVQRHNAAGDAWITAHWRELLAMTPRAKFILNTRDFDSWTQSLQRIPDFWASPLLYDRYLRHRIYGTDSPRDVQQLWRAWNRHHEEVRREVPAGQLLELPLPFAWEPLCEFLSVPVSSEPFPHLNRGGCSDVEIRGSTGRRSPALA